MANKLLLSLLPFASFIGMLSAAPSSFITQYSAFQNWLPIMFIAVLLSFAIVSVYYIIGAVLDNKRIKSSAVGEFNQAIGTGVMIVIIIAVLTLIGTTQFSWISLLSTSSLQTLCTQLSGSKVDMLHYEGPSASNPNILTTICTASQNAASLTDITDRLDYGLYASYIIIANLTDQAANNLDALYVMESWLGFLGNFNEVVQVCWPGTACLLPITPRVSGGTVTISMQPLSGYTGLISITQPIEGEAGLTFYILYLQQLIITMVLFAWPYILGAGIVLRSTLFTRKLGGLFMALALAMLLIYPLMYLVEYTSFTNSQLGPIGASNVGGIPLYEKLSGGNPGGKVIVYGALNTQSGYVPIVSGTGYPTAVTSTCTTSQYVYESECGNPGSAIVSTQYQCLSTPLSASTQLCAGGYVLPSTAPAAGCPIVARFVTPYAYESQCGNPDSAGGCLYVTGSNPNPQPCPSSGYVPISIIPKFPQFKCAPGTYIKVSDCNDLSKYDTTFLSCTYLVNVPPDPNTNQPELCETQLESNINFFVLPQASRVLSYYGCNPNDAYGGLIASEAAFAIPYLTPFVALAQVFNLFGSPVSSLPVTSLNAFPGGGCQPSNAINAMFGLINLYGIIFVSSVFTLMLNILVGLAGLAGLATLFGGDTSILGLSRLI